MSFSETYFKINWPVLNEYGISKVNNELIVDYNACEMLRKFRCPFTLAALIHMASHNAVSIIARDDMIIHFYGEEGANRGNSDYFDSVLDKLLKSDFILIQE